MTKDRKVIIKLTASDLHARERQCVAANKGVDDGVHEAMRDAVNLWAGPQGFALYAIDEVNEMAAKLAAKSKPAPRRRKAAKR